MAIYHYFDNKAGLLETMVSMEGEGPANVFIAGFHRILGPVSLLVRCIERETESG